MAYTDVESDIWAKNLSSNFDTLSLPVHLAVAAWVSNFEWPGMMWCSCALSAIMLIVIVIAFAAEECRLVLAFLISASDFRWFSISKKKKRRNAWRLKSFGRELLLLGLSIPRTSTHLISFISFHLVFFFLFWPGLSLSIFGAPLAGLISRNKVHAEVLLSIPGDLSAPAFV